MLRRNTKCEEPNIVDGQQLEDVKDFTYLGSVVDTLGGTDKDALTRIDKARAAFLMLRKVWSSRELSFWTKLRIFRSNVKSVLLYGAETRRTTITIQGRIQSFINNCLRRKFGVCWQDKVTNEELWHWAREVPVSIQIRRRKWGWLRHTLRKPTNNIARQALSWIPLGRRKRGVTKK